MRRLAATLRVVALVAMVVNTAAAVLTVFQPSFQDAHGFLTISIDAAEIAALSMWQRAFVTAIPAITFAYAMYRLMQLLQLAACGEVFSAPAATYLRSFGILSFVTTLAGSVLPFLAQLLDSWLTRAAPGKFTLSIDSSDIWNIFISAVFMLVARVLADAYQIAEENRQII